MQTNNRVVHWTTDNGLYKRTYNLSTNRMDSNFYPNDTEFFHLTPAQTIEFNFKETIRPGTDDTNKLVFDRIRFLNWWGNEIYPNKYETKETVSSDSLGIVTYTFNDTPVYYLFQMPGRLPFEESQVDSYTQHRSYHGIITLDCVDGVSREFAIFNHT